MWCDSEKRSWQKIIIGTCRANIFLFSFSCGEHYHLLQNFKLNWTEFHGSERGSFWGRSKYNWIIFDAIHKPILWVVEKKRVSVRSIVPGAIKQAANSDRIWLLCSQIICLILTFCRRCIFEDATFVQLEIPAIKLKGLSHGKCVVWDNGKKLKPLGIYDT